MSINRPVLAGVLAMGAMVAGCASQADHVAVVAPVPVTPPALGPMPRPPAGMTADAMIPARLPDGGYATPNHALSAAATMWHVRAALNVAALACRGAGEDRMAAAYNALLKTQKAPLAKTQKALIAEYGARYGNGQAAYDDAMTRLYNFFAQPAAKTGFCAAAADVLAQSGTVPADGLDAFASTALARLDAPFVDLYRRYDAYRVELASWQSERLERAMQPVKPQVRVAMAASAPVAVAAQPPVPAPRIGYDQAIFRMP